MRPIAYSVAMLAGSVVYLATLLGRPSVEFSSPGIGIAFMAFGAVLLAIDAAQTYFPWPTKRAQKLDEA
jgi:hypothetical protein